MHCTTLDMMLTQCEAVQQVRHQDSLLCPNKLTLRGFLVIVLLGAGSFGVNCPLPLASTVVWKGSLTSKAVYRTI